MGMVNGADPIITGYDDEFSGAILCPMDFGEYNRELDSVLRNEKCKVPIAPPSTGLSMTLTSLGAAKLTVPYWNSWSNQMKLPIKSWVVGLYIDKSMVYTYEIVVKYVTCLPKDETPGSCWSNKVIHLFAPAKYEFAIEKSVCEELYDAVKDGTLYVMLKAKNACGVSEEGSESVLVTKGKEIIPKPRLPPISHSVGST